MPNIKHLRKSLAWLDWRWRLQLLCQNIPSHRRRFWCMDLRGRFKFWHAWHTNFGSRHSVRVQVDKAPGHCKKWWMLQWCPFVGEPWKSSFIGPFQSYKNFCGFFLFYSHFRRFQKIAEKFARSCRIHRLLVATALENSLPWQACSIENMLQNPVWDTSSGGFLCIDPRLLEPCQKETDSSCDLLIRWGQHIAIVNFLLLSQLLGIPNVSLLAWSKNLRQQIYLWELYLGISWERKTVCGHSCSESHCSYGSPRKDHSRSERTLRKEFCWVLNEELATTPIETWPKSAGNDNVVWSYLIFSRFLEWYVGTYYAALQRDPRRNLQCRGNFNRQQTGVYFDW